MGNKDKSMKDLQKELHEARNYHINLHVEYTQLKNAYEKLVNVTEEDWEVVEKFGLTEHVNKLISKFWVDIEFITTAFFDILELLNRKEYLDKSILTIWKSQLVQTKDKEAPHEEVVPSSDDGIAVVPGYLEYLNSQLVELRGRIKWVEYNLMKYKFAASHGNELKSMIDHILKGAKKHSKKWQIFARSSKSNKKLEGEVEWYRKRLKFFKEDLQRLKSVQQVIFQKFLTPDDQKFFHSKASSLDNRLKGYPTNYPGSWIETSRHSGLSKIWSGHSATSGNTVLPWTISVAGPSKAESHSATNTGIAACQADNAEGGKIKMEILSEKREDADISDGSVSNMPNSVDQKCFMATKSDILPQRQESQQVECVNLKLFIDQEMNQSLDGSKMSHNSSVVSTFQGFGDAGLKNDVCKGTLTAFNDGSNDTQKCTSKADVQEMSSDDRNPFLKNGPSEIVEKIAPSNPFEDDERIVGDVCVSSSIAGTSTEEQKKPEEILCGSYRTSPCSSGSSNRSKNVPTSESSYESAEEILNHANDEPTTSQTQSLPNDSGSVRPGSDFASNVYVPCAMSLQAERGSGLSQHSVYSSPIRFPHVTHGPNYELFLETDKSERDELKKFSTYVQGKKS